MDCKSDEERQEHEQEKRLLDLPGIDFDARYYPRQEEWQINRRAYHKQHHQAGCKCQVSTSDLYNLGDKWRARSQS